MMTRSQLTFEGPRPAPAEWLERFREVEPTAEMIDLGSGFWLVGSFQFDSRYAAIGRNMVAIHLGLEDRGASQYIRPSILRKAHAITEGLRPITMYSDQELWSGEAFLDFRERDWNWRVRAWEAVEERLDGRTKTEHARLQEYRARERTLMHRELAHYLIARRTRGVRVPADIGDPRGAVVERGFDDSQTPAVETAA